MNYAEYLKRENAIKALLELLQALEIIKQRQTRFGPIRYFSDAEMEAFALRMYNRSREQ